MTRAGWASTLVLTLFLVAPNALTQQKNPAAREPQGHHYVLPADKDTVQWGWLDPNEKPKLVVNSGDTVSIETLRHSLDEIKSGVPMDEIVKLRLANPGGGPHSVTGPVYVNGAEPGDTLEIRIMKIVIKDEGFNFNLPGKQFPTIGLLAAEFPEGHVQYFKLDSKTMTTEFKPGIILPLRPFPGTIAVGPDPNEPKEKAGPPIHDAKGRTSTLRPWKNGSNMDVNELQVGSILYFPVFEKGALIWTGDSHCLQGDGEANLTALECSYKEIEIQPIVRKDLHIEWPRAETSANWVFMGFDEDLNEAMKIAVRETVNFLAAQKTVPMSREEAYALTPSRVDGVANQSVFLSAALPLPHSYRSAAIGSTRVALHAGIYVASIATTKITAGTKKYKDLS